MTALDNRIFVLHSQMSLTVSKFDSEIKILHLKHTSNIDK